MGNECLLVNYSKDSGDDAVLTICRTRSNDSTITHTWRGERARDLYLDILELVSFGRISKEDFEG